MDTSSLLFTSRSLWTMLHGIVLGSAAMLGLGAALFHLYAVRARDGAGVDLHPRAFSWLLVFIAASLWMTVIGGTYIVFPPYRAAPPADLTDLTAYPRSLLLASPGTAWLHAFAMEIKEHVPWVAVMLSTAVAFVGARRGSVLLGEVRGFATALLWICFALVGAVALLGTFINKVAPLQ